MNTYQKQDRLPPYVSYKTWIKMLDCLKINVPQVIDSSYYASESFSGSSAKKLRTTLRFLGLTNDTNVPTAQLTRLVRAYRGEGQVSKAAVLSEILKTAYPMLFTKDFDLKRATLGQLIGHFERLGVARNMQKHCISFFLHLAADAEIELSPYLAGRSRLGIGRKSVVLKSRERKRKANVAEPLGSTQVSKVDELTLSKLHPALVGLLKELPAPGTVWEAEEKAKFRKAFEAILDVVYPSEIKGAGSD